IADVMNRAVAITQDDHAQPDFLDEAAFPFDIHDVAHADLVFDQNEKAADDILHEILRAETDGETDDAGAGENGADINADLFEGHHAGDGNDEKNEEVTDESGKGVGALLNLGVA